MESKPNALVVVLAGALLAALLVIAYLLGQRSGSPVVVAAPVERLAAPAPAPIPVEPSALAERSVAPPPLPSTPTRPPMPAAAVAEAPPLPPPAPTPAARTAALSASEDPAQEAIRAYFARVAEVQVDGTDSQAFAQEFVARIAGSLTTGDTTAVDELVQKVERVKQRLAAIQAPGPCATYRTKALANLGEVQGLLGDMRGAIQSKDLSRLSSLPAKAESIQAHADELQALERALLARAR